MHKLYLINSKLENILNKWLLYDYFALIITITIKTTFIIAISKRVHPVYTYMYTDTQNWVWFLKIKKNKNEIYVRMS